VIRLRRVGTPLLMSNIWEVPVAQRGSDQHGPARDDELKRELANELRAGGPTRSQSWREPEMPEPDENLSEDRS
jgi:hypothetical protein